MSDLATLRTAKAAVTEGLISDEDFELVKYAYLKSQQLKAGLDAGFIRPEDYSQARDAFLCSLDFRVALTAQAPPQSMNGHVAPQPAPTPAPRAAPAAAPAAAVHHAPSPAPAPMSRPHAASVAAPKLSTLPTNSQRSASVPTYSNASRGTGTVPVPSDLPRIGRAATAKDKKSMSGVIVQDDCVNIFNHIKTKSAYKWVVYRVDDSGQQVIIEALGAKDSVYEDFVAQMPDNQGRYGIFDYEYTNNDGCIFHKLVFVHWIPETAATKIKLVYASTKDFFKGFLEGIGAELHATDFEDLEESNVREKVQLNLTRK